MKPIRIQRRRVKGWKMPPNTISVTRPSRWGNEFLIDPHTGNRSECIRAFREERLREQKNRPARFEAKFLAPIRGKNLACWCGLSDECHADFWLAEANREEAR